MYLYVQHDGNIFWSQNEPTEGDHILMEKNHLRVFANHGGTFVEMVILVGGKMVFEDVDKGHRRKNRATNNVYTFGTEEASGLPIGLWLEVPPRIPIGPSGMKPSP